MTDLEITRRCAKAMGRDFEMDGIRLLAKLPKSSPFPGAVYEYDPLHDDAQTMALMRKFDLSVWGHSWSAGAWKYHAEFSLDGDGTNSILGHGDTHNKAICECVAKMQAAK